MKFNSALNLAKHTETPNPELVALPTERLNAAKAAYNTRRVDLSAGTHLLVGPISPRAGDLVLARVEAIGQHTRIELETGRRAYLHVGDEIIVCYGARYAPDQFEAYVPKDLSRCHLVAAGGVAACFENKHSSMKKPTVIQPVGLLSDADGRPVNTLDWSLPPVSRSVDRPYTVAVLGTAMNAGKTTTAASLIRGYKQQGMQVGAAKVTGTGAGGDRWMMTDAGAHTVLDFTDAGVPSTFGVKPAAVESICTKLVDHLAASGADVIVLEVADGLFQQETALLLESPVFRALVDDFVFAAGDALGACAGVDRLRADGVPVVAVSGALTASPLATREAEQVLGLPVVSIAELASGSWLPEPAAHDEIAGAPVVRLHANAGSSRFRFAGA